jgi:hypothetical protein
MYSYYKAYVVLLNTWIGRRVYSVRRSTRDTQSDMSICDEEKTDARRRKNGHRDRGKDI